MCGICGIHGSDNLSRQELMRMNQAICHRGPDDEGYWMDTHVGLGHRRLSIIDLNTGRQPIGNETGTIWIVFNGEIYNFQQLKPELEHQGHRFATNTDTEVILHLYESHGENCLNFLNGMFAFAIWDSLQQKLFLARDRIGQKPLFYCQRPNRFLFASEVKSILQANDVPRTIDMVALHHYMSLRFIPAPHTMFEGIHKLPAGHFLTLQHGQISINRYWDLSFRNKLRLSLPDYIQGLEEKLLSSVRSHMISDVPVGAFLSGGMDTSTVVAMMPHVAQQPFKTFCIGVNEQDFNELPYARMVADRYQTDHVERIVSADLIQLLPQMIHHLDEPSDPIAACMFEAARLASEHVKVVLGGDGGDELFAGFDRYMGMQYLDGFARIPESIRRRLIAPLIARIPESFGYKSFSQQLRWIVQLADYQAGSRYAEATAFFRFNHLQKAAMFQDNHWQGLKNLNSHQVIIDHFNTDNADNLLDRMLYADFMTRLTEHTLMLTDRMNMAFGLEARSPFLDHELVEYLAKFPPQVKIRNGQTKYILRKLAVSYLPKQIIHRKKQGFMFPIAYWFKSQLYPMLNRLLPNSRLVTEGILRKEPILRLIEEHRANRIDHHVRLWILLNMEIWYRL